VNLKLADVTDDEKNISWGKPEPEPAEWDEPLALAEFDPPPFPTDALLSWLCSFVEAVAISLQVPVDMPGTLVLTACGAAVAGKFIVRMTPDWKEPLVLQALLIMLSGEKKSATPLHQFFFRHFGKVLPNSKL
jgi:hypothetical protein